jgi:hypothetical protein
MGPDHHGVFMYSLDLSVSNQKQSSSKKLPFERCSGSKSTIKYVSEGSIERHLKWLADDFFGKVYERWKFGRCFERTEFIVLRATKQSTTGADMAMSWLTAQVL